MERILVGLMVLALCVPTMAATVSIVDNSDGTGTITVTAEGGLNIVGLALDVDVIGGQVTSVDIAPPTCNIYLDAAYDLGGSYTYGAGTPNANQTAGGEIALPSASFTLSVGCLNGPATPGADGAVSIVITLAFDAESTVCIQENPIRGGIVLTDGTGEDITNGAAGVVCGTLIPCPCICWTGDAASTLEFVAVAAAGALNDCWCASNNPRQCHGDATGLPAEGKLLYHVSTLDLGILLNAWNKNLADLVAANPADICADFDHQAEGKLLYRVSTIDLGILLANWNIAGGPAPDCADALGVQ